MTSLSSGGVGSLSCAAGVYLRRAVVWEPPCPFLGDLGGEIIKGCVASAAPAPVLNLKGVQLLLQSSEVKLSLDEVSLQRGKFCAHPVELAFFGASCFLQIHERYPTAMVVGTREPYQSALQEIVWAHGKEW